MLYTLTDTTEKWYKDICWYSYEMMPAKTGG